MSERKSQRPPKSEAPKPAEREVPLSERPTLPPKPEQRDELRLYPQAETLERHEGRNANQDDYLEKLSEDGRTGLFSVADGMGGTKGGEVASGIAVDTLEKYFSQMEELRKRRSEGDDEASLEAEAKLLERGIREADERVKSQRGFSEMLYNMGTTCVAVRLTLDANNNYHAIVGSVGDSRAYLSHPDGKLETLTVDDNMALVVTAKKQGWDVALRIQDILDNSLGEGQLAALMDVVKKKQNFPEGVLKKEDIEFLMAKMENQWFKYYHANFAQVFNTIGDGVSPHMRTIPVERGSKLILATDGTDGLMRDEIELIAAGRLSELPYTGARQAAEAWPDNTAKALVWAAKQRQKEKSPPFIHPRSRGQDDVTAIVIPVPNVDGDE